MTRHMIFKTIITLAFFTILSAVSVVAQPTLTLSSVTVEAGDTFQIALTLDTDGESISALSTDILFDASVIQITGTELGPAATSAGKMISQNEVNPGLYRVGLFSLSNADAIGNGIVIYISGTVDSAASDENVILSQNASGSDPSGTPITVSGLSATISIGEIAGIGEITVLTNTSPPLTINTGTDACVYGTAASNQIILEGGAKVKLLNFPGSNEITIKSNSSLFTVSRLGAYVTFKGSDGTVLEIPATTTAQTILFNDQALPLSIYSNQVMLDDQIIVSGSVPIE